MGEFVSDVLLVPEKCKFFHKERKDLCVSNQQWHSVAKEVTEASASHLAEVEEFKPQREGQNPPLSNNYLF